MKKSILFISTLIILFSCSKPSNPPVPSQTPSATANQINAYNYTSDFIGNWDCFDWVVDDITGIERQRRIMFSTDSDSSSINMTMNQYDQFGVFQLQLHILVPVSFDTTYFNITNLMGSAPYKGYLMNDSTMMVYQYEDHPINGIDTFQVDTFFKAP